MYDKYGYDIKRNSYLICFHFWIYYNYIFCFLRERKKREIKEKKKKINNKKGKLKR